VRPVRPRDLDERKIIADAFKLKASFSRGTGRCGLCPAGFLRWQRGRKALDVKFERLRVAVEAAEKILTKR
jgi:hypothetical protein